MKLLPILLGMIVQTWAIGQGGKVMDLLSMKSEILNSDRNYAIYLPPDYETSERHYPVLYLLHGAGDDQTGWVQFGEVKHIADNAIYDGIATSMIIVMPDANTGKRGYYNDISGDWDYEDFFFKEFMPFVEQKYRIKKDKRYRAIAGLSMGGGGTFIYALHRPDLFSSACPLSAWLGFLSLDEYKKKTLPENHSFSEEEIRNHFKIYNPIEGFADLDHEALKKVRWYIDCGDDDFLYEGNSRLHIAMKKAGIHHEYRVRDGRHSWTYWRTSLPEVLRFVSESFHQY